MDLTQTIAGETAHGSFTFSGGSGLPSILFGLLAVFSYAPGLEASPTGQAPPWLSLANATSALRGPGDDLVFGRLSPGAVRDRQSLLHRLVPRPSASGQDLRGLSESFGEIADAGAASCRRCGPRSPGPSLCQPLEGGRIHPSGLRWLPPDLSPQRRVRTASRHEQRALSSHDLGHGVGAFVLGFAMVLAPGQRKRE